MKSKTFNWAVRIVAIVVLAIGTGALAQAPSPVHYVGILSDYTPLSPSAKPTGPWEMRGEWTLDLQGASGKADFSAVMAMELSDYWVLTTNADPTNAAVRGAHTHNITIADAMVTPIAGGFEVSGPVAVTANGSPAPFSASPSTLTVDITGGTSVGASNVTLTFSGAATGHFGSHAIHGVVRNFE
ncbi:MAG TPA: hypothetical protein VGF20_01550 [Candidatus Acidoferrum sp.]|jgi:hypothetical protein